MVAPTGCEVTTITGSRAGAEASGLVADAAVSVEEAELLRAVCDMLDCPMPPLLPGQTVSKEPALPSQTGRA